MLTSAQKAACTRAANKIADLLYRAVQDGRISWRNVDLSETPAVAVAAVLKAMGRA